jgi:hypothetical protein
MTDLADQLAEGQETIRQLRAVLLPELSWQHFLKASPRQRIMLRVFLGTNGLISHERLRAAYEQTGEVVAPKTMAVQMCRLRKILKARGISIMTVWGEGFAMTPENKQRLVDLLNPAGRP